MTLRDELMHAPPRQPLQELAARPQSKVPRGANGSKRSIAELRDELAEVERMIRLLEWVSTRPRAA